MSCAIESAPKPVPSSCITIVNGFSFEKSERSGSDSASKRNILDMTSANGTQQIRP